MAKTKIKKIVVGSYWNYSLSINCYWVLPLIWGKSFIIQLWRLKLC